MGLVPKPVRQAGAAPLPEPSQLSDLATLRASDLRVSAILAKRPCGRCKTPTPSDI